MPARPVSHRLKTNSPIHWLPHGRCIEYHMMASHLLCKIARLPGQRGPDPLVASRWHHAHRKETPYSPFAGRDIEHTSPHHLTLLKSDYTAYLTRIYPMQGCAGFSLVCGIVREIIHLAGWFVLDGLNVKGASMDMLVREITQMA